MKMISRYLRNVILLMKTTKRGLFDCMVGAYYLTSLQIAMKKLFNKSLDN